MKKPMKTALVSVLSLLLLIGLISCGNSNPSESPASGGGAADNTESGNYVVGYIAKNTVDAFHATINNAASEALDKLAADGTISSWNLYDGQTDPVTQCNLLEDAINMGCNLIILLPAEAAGCSPILERCKEEDIPCIVVNSKTDNTDELATSYVGSDDVEAGEIMANFVKEQIPDGGGYGHIQGVIGNSAQIDRGEGIKNILGSDESWTLLEGCEQSGEWQAEKAVKFAEDWLTKYGDNLNAIICDNDDMSSAVQAAMNTAGREDIVCIGVDGNAGPLQMVKEGTLRATVYQDGAGQVKTAIDLIPKIKEGESVDKEIMVGFVLVTKDNVDTYLS